MDLNHLIILSKLGRMNTKPIPIAMPIEKEYPFPNKNPIAPAPNRATIVNITKIGTGIIPLLLERHFLLNKNEKNLKPSLFLIVEIKFMCSSSQKNTVNDSDNRQKKPGKQWVMQCLTTKLANTKTARAFSAGANPFVRVSPRCGRSSNLGAYDNVQSQ